MKLIAKKPCSFGGERFYIGDEIPVELVKEPKTQEKYGILTIVETDTEADASEPAITPIVIADPVLTICVRLGEEEMELEPTDDGLQDIFNVLIGEPGPAIATINKMTDNDALILLHLSDRRATVKKAAKARAEELQKIEEQESGEPQESEGDQ